MHQLSAHDASFLYADTPRANGNVTLIHIYDPSTAPGGTLRFKTILKHVESRLERLPNFRRRVQRVPLDLDHPYWVDDENFDLEYHVRHIALPRPGDWRQFCIQASRIHARALDLDRPLWELYVIEGLDGFLDLPAGSFALLTKVHHAAIDVEHGREITMLLHDTSPRAGPPAPPPPWFPDEGPGGLRMFARGLRNTVGAAVSLAGPLGQALRRATPAAVKQAGDLLRRPQRMPVTRFNSVVSPHRVFETRRFGLDEFKAIRALVPGATVNDVVLAVCGGGLRQYLEHHGELPSASLKAIAPLYVRGAAAADRAELSWMRVPLGTDVADPVQRLAQIVQRTASSDVAAQAVRARDLSTASQRAPASTLALAAKLLGRATAGLGRRSPLANCTVTNVPGPEQPLYLCGARMTYFSAIMPIADGMGLVIAVTSYDGRIIISPTSCRELLPDPEAFTQQLRDSFQQYLALARAVPPVRSARPRASARGAASPASPKARRASTAPRAARGGRPRPAAPAG